MVHRRTHTFSLATRLSSRSTVWAPRSARSSPDNPFTRFAAYLRTKAVATEGIEREVDDEIAGAIRRFEAMPPPDPIAMFEHVFSELPPGLAEQREEVAQRLGAPGTAESLEERPASPPMRGQRSTRWQS